MLNILAIRFHITKIEGIDEAEHEHEIKLICATLYINQINICNIYLKIKDFSVLSKKSLVLSSLVPEWFLISVSKWSIKFPAIPRLQLLPKVADEKTRHSIVRLSQPPLFITVQLVPGVSKKLCSCRPVLRRRRNRRLLRRFAACCRIENGQFASPWESPTLLSGFFFLSPRFLPSRLRIADLIIRSRRKYLSLVGFLLFMI